MKGLSLLEIVALLEEQFPTAKISFRHCYIQITSRNEKRKIRAYLDRLVIPYHLNVEVK